MSKSKVVTALFVMFAVLPAIATAQQALTGGTRCDLPSVSFWSPPGQQSGAVKVDVEFFLLDIIEVNDRLNRFTLDFTLTLRWQDPRLESAVADSAGCITMLEQVWHPHFIFVNSGEGTGDYDGLVEVLPGAVVQYSKRFTREFSAQLDLRQFPFDSQQLTINIASILYGPDHVIFSASEQGTDMLEGASIPGWRIGEVTSLEPDGPIQTKTSSHSSLAFSVLVERESGYYFWRLVFPLLMISLMAWSVFWLQPTQLGPQVTVATGAVFSMMAFLVSQGQILPSVSYISIADKLIVASVILVFVAFGEAVLTGVLGQAGRIALAEKIDRYARWLYLVAVVVIFSVAL